MAASEAVSNMGKAWFIGGTMGAGAALRKGKHPEGRRHSAVDWRLRYALSPGSHAPAPMLENRVLKRRRTEATLLVDAGGETMRNHITLPWCGGLGSVATA